MKEKLKLYISENYIEPHDRTFGIAKKMSFRESAIFEDRAMASFECGSIQEYIDENISTNKFQKLLFKYIDERNLKDSDVYNKAFIDRRLFSKIRSDVNYHPTKETIISLGLSLNLNEDEILDLLNSASYTLSKTNYFDLIIKFCFINQIYDILEVNSLLNEYNCKLLNV